MLECIKKLGSQDVRKSGVAVASEEVWHCRDPLEQAAKHDILPDNAVGRFGERKVLVGLFPDENFRSVPTFISINHGDISGNESDALTDLDC